MPIFRTVEIESHERSTAVVDRLRERTKPRRWAPRHGFLTGRVEDSAFKLTFVHPFTKPLVVVRGAVEGRIGATVLRARVRPTAFVLIYLTFFGVGSLVLSGALASQERWGEAAGSLAFGWLLFGALFLAYDRYARRAEQALRSTAAQPSSLSIAASPVIEVLETERFYRHADALRSAAQAGDWSRVAEMCHPQVLGDLRVETVSPAEWWDLTATLKREAHRLHAPEPALHRAV